MTGSLEKMDTPAERGLMGSIESMGLKLPPVLALSGVAVSPVKEEMKPKETGRAGSLALPSSQMISKHKA